MPKAYRRWQQYHAPDAQVRMNYIQCMKRAAMASAIFEFEASAGAEEVDRTLGARGGVSSSDGSRSTTWGRS